MFLLCIPAAVGQPGLGIVIYNAILSRINESVFKKTVALITLPGGLLAAAFLLLAGGMGWAREWFLPAEATLLATLRAAYLYASAVGGVIAVIQVIRNPRRLYHPPEELVNHAQVHPIPRRSPCPWGGARKAILRAVAPINQLTDLEVITKEVVLPNLPPAFDGFRLAQISDFHIDSALEQNFYRRAAEIVVRQRPDVIVLTGDYVSRARQIDRIPEFLAGYCAPMGVYFIRGNHDFWTRPGDIRRHLESLGYRCLPDCAEVLRRGDDAIALVGIEHPYGGRIRDWNRVFPPDLPACRIALLHTPDAIFPAARSGCDLALAGHTHGGQIQFPFIGPTLSPSKYGRRFAAGWHRVGATLLYTNRGLGAFFPIRVLCRPEVTVFVLRSRECARRGGNETPTDCAGDC